MKYELTILLSEHYSNKDGDGTIVKFTNAGVLTCDDLFGYFIRAALAFGFQRGSIDDVILGLADELNTKETEDKDD